MEAFKNCMTPLHVATVLGHEDITRYLAVECKANVNLQSRGKKYSLLHLCVLANKPDTIVELLNNTDADPLLEDSSGRALLDMVFQYIPGYVEIIQSLLEKM
jgi:hypothetical protein